jgi:hypothetical protein
MPASPCEEAPLSLAEGEHRVRTAKGWLIDRLRLASAPPATETTSTSQGRESVIGPPYERPRLLTVTSSSSSRIAVTATRADSPYYLVTGQAYDDRWTATMDGRPLGKPIVIDGYSVGWRIDDLEPHHFVISFRPQHLVTMAQIGSLVALGLALLLFLKRRRDPSLDIPPLEATAQSGGRQAEWIGAFPGGEPGSTARRAFVTLVLTSLLFFIGGWAGLAAGAAAALILFGSRRLAPRLPRRYSGREAALLVPAALLAAIPFVLLFNGLPAPWQLTPAFVRDNMLAGYLAQSALVLAVAGTILDVRGRTRPR